MGKRSRVAKGKDKKVKPARQYAVGGSSSYAHAATKKSAAHWVELGTEACQIFQFEKAAACFEKALSLEPQSTHILDALAEVMLELGNPDLAQQYLRQSIKLDPSSNYAKYMYLSQICENGMEAASLVERAIKLIDTRRKDEMAKDPTCEAARDLLREQCSANCTLAEIFLNVAEDAFEKNPDNTPFFEALDKKAEAALAAAFVLVPDGFEPLLAMANLRLSQSKIDEAKQGMTKICQKIEPLMKAYFVPEVSEEDKQAIGLPPLDYRIGCGKQLAELEMWTEAISMLESVIAENDRNIEVWFLLGLAHYHNNAIPEATEAAEYAASLFESPEGYDGTLDTSALEELLQNAKTLDAENVNSTDREDDDADDNDKMQED